MKQGRLVSQVQIFTFRLEAIISLTTVNWQVITTVQATSSVSTYVDLEYQGRIGFYSVEVVPQ